MRTLSFNKHRMSKLVSETEVDSKFTVIKRSWFMGSTSGSMSTDLDKALLSDAKGQNLKRKMTWFEASQIKKIDGKSIIVVICQDL